MARIVPAPLFAASAALVFALAGPAPVAEAAVLHPASGLEAHGADEGIATLSEAALYASSAAAPLDAGSVKDPATYCELDALIAQANRDIQALARRGSTGSGVFGGVSGAMDARVLGDRLHTAADAATRSAEEKAAETRAAEQRAAERRAAEEREDQALRGTTGQGSPAGAVAYGDAQGSAPDGDDGAWNVSYRDEYGAAEGAADGACTQWADGYYVAHDWSDSGEQIASKPGTVVVDGQRYAYAGSMVVPEGSDYYASGVYDFTHADGGIGFQTCCDGGYLVTTSLTSH